MRKSLKIAAVATVLLLVLGVAVFVYASSQNSLSANADTQTVPYMRSMWTSGSDNSVLPDNVTPPCFMGRMPGMRRNGFGGFGGFLQNATLSTVEGTVVSEVRGILILNTASGEVRVMLPKEWTVGNEVIGRASLFNGTFASSGQSVTVKVLESNVFSNASFSLNEMLGYEAVNATSTHAYAVLPFNIQPSS
jgi:hypothetical protein